MGNIIASSTVQIGLVLVSLSTCSLLADECVPRDPGRPANTSTGRQMKAASNGSTGEGLVSQTT